MRHDTEGPSAKHRTVDARIHWLALQGEHAEDALTHAPRSRALITPAHDRRLGACSSRRGSTWSPSAVRSLEMPNGPAIGQDSEARAPLRINGTRQSRNPTGHGTPLSGRPGVLLMIRLNYFVEVCVRVAGRRSPSLRTSHRLRQRRPAAENTCTTLEPRGERRTDNDTRWQLRLDPRGRWDS